VGVLFDIVAAALAIAVLVALTRRAEARWSTSRPWQATSGYPLAGYPAPGYPQPGYAQPGYPQHASSTGFVPPGYPPSGYGPPESALPTPAPPADLSSYYATP